MLDREARQIRVVAQPQLASARAASHSHDDHYDPVILDWKKKIPDIQYFFGWKDGNDTSAHYLVGPRGEYASSDLNIATINSHHSGVPEVAWLVKVDGLVVYHNGDCQPGDASSEYAFLKTKTDHVEVAFLPPVHQEELKYTIQTTEFLRQFSPRAVFSLRGLADDEPFGPELPGADPAKALRWLRVEPAPDLAASLLACALCRRWLGRPLCTDLLESLR